MGIFWLDIQNRNKQNLYFSDKNEDKRNITYSDYQNKRMCKNFHLNHAHMSRLIVFILIINYNYINNIVICH